MGPMAIAAAANVAGSVFGGIGASQQASAMRRAAKKGQRDIRNFTKDQIEKSDALGEKKQTYLEEGDPFAEMGRFIFGDSGAGTYANLRKTQADFAKLAAGDTSGFQKEVASMVSNSLASTFGGPRGSFENLSAKNLLNFRQLGANTSMSLTNFFGSTGQQLIGNKFGILDQTFDRQMRLKEYETNAVNQLRMQAAGAAGVPMAAIGNVANAVGSAFNSYGLQQSNQQALASNDLFRNKQLDLMYRQIGLTPPTASSRASEVYSGGGGSKQTIPVSGLPQNLPAQVGYQDSYSASLTDYLGGVMANYGRPRLMQMGQNPYGPSVNYNQDYPLLPPVGDQPSY